jgi:hypothetical protein
MWGAGGACIALTATGTSLMFAAPARAAVDPGVGSSYAQSIQATPKDGSLAVGVIMGEALAGHTNSFARAQSLGLDETAIGSSLGAYNCGKAPSSEQTSLVSQPLTAETGQSGADKGFTLTPTSGASSEGPNQAVPPSFGSTEYAQATATPYGEADTSYSSVAVPGSVFTVSGTSSKAWSGIVNGQREAGASEYIQSLDLVGTTVQIGGLKWDVVYPSGGSGAPTGSFSMGSITVAGKALPTNDPSKSLLAANQVLGLLGLQLSVPTITNSQGAESVSPLQIEVVPNTTRDSIIDPVVSGAQPITGPLEGDLENGTPGEPASVYAELCQSDTPISVADIAIAGVDGAGSFVTSFGGVQASSGAAPVNPYNLGGPSFSLSPGQTEFIPGTPAVAGSSATPGGSVPVGSTSIGGQTATPSVASGSATAPSGSTGTSGGSQSAPQPTQNIAAVGTEAGGPLLAIGLCGLGALLLLAEGDRRIMRRAQRGVQSFDDFED